MEHPEVGGARREFLEFWNDRLHAVTSVWYWKDAVHQTRPRDSNVRHEEVKLCKSATDSKTARPPVWQLLVKAKRITITEMSCVDFMYQFYSPYFSYKTQAEDTQKYPSQPLYDTGIPGPGPSSFFDNGLLPEKDLRDVDKSAQPKATHYLTSNCVLFTYFTGETAAVVDEHFSRALSQPSSYTLDKTPPSNKPYARSDTPLMCHRKLPPSFWNSSYQPPCSNNNSSNFADAYFQSSLYSFHKAWPYHYGSQSHTYPHPQSAAHALSYPGMDATGRLTSHYGSLMMPGPSLSGRVGDTRHHGQYDLAKSSDAFSGYYSMGRFGSDMEASLPGLDIPLQQAKKEHYW